jgi:hypothetical protein
MTVSLSTVVDRYYARTYGPPAGVIPPDERTTRRGRSALRGAAEQLVQWIPAEVLAFYVPTIVPFTDAATLWGIYVFGVIVTPAFVFILAREKFQADKQRGQVFKAPIFPMLAGVVAFAIWGASLPGSVFMRMNLVHGVVMTLAIALATVILSLGERAVKASKAA